jgi:ATP-dependent protease Clp ATPase subunit
MADTRREIYCTFCGVDPKAARHLVTGFGAVICDECVGLCHQAEKGLADSARVVPMRPVQLGSTTLVTYNVEAAAHPFGEACPFCGLPPTSERRLFLAEHASICTDCIRLCDGVFRDREAPSPNVGTGPGRT